jgi:hypothetical protein
MPTIGAPSSAVNASDSDTDEILPPELLPYIAETLAGSKRGKRY